MGMRSTNPAFGLFPGVKCQIIDVGDRLRVKGGRHAVVEGLVERARHEAQGLRLEVHAGSDVILDIHCGMGLFMGAEERPYRRRRCEELADPDALS